jgi:hypothetical protein
MKLRLALSALVYAAALSVAVLVVTGHLSLTPFTEDTQQVMALENGDGGSSILLCYGCNYNTTSAVGCIPPLICGGYSYNPCQWGCYQQQTYYNPCQWGCNQQVYYNPCQWGCNQQQVIYVQVQVNSGCNWGCGNNWQNNGYWNAGCQCQRYW